MLCMVGGVVLKNVNVQRLVAVPHCSAVDPIEDTVDGIVIAVNAQHWLKTPCESIPIPSAKCTAFKFLQILFFGY